MNAKRKQIFHDSARACIVSAMRMTGTTRRGGGAGGAGASTLAPLRDRSGRTGVGGDRRRDPAAARRDEAKAAFSRGNTAYNLGKYTDAIADFERAYALSRLPEILFNLGPVLPQAVGGGAAERARSARAALLRGGGARGAVVAVRPDAEQFITELDAAVAAAEARERQGTIAAARAREALQLAQTLFTRRPAH